MFTTENGKDQQQIQSDDMQNVSEIFAEHGDFLMCILKSKFSPQMDMDLEDLFQDLFVSLAERPVSSDIKCVKSYLFRAINNDIKDQYRKARTYRSHKCSYQHFRKREHRSKLEDPANQIEYKDLLQHIEMKISRHLPEHEANTVTQKLLLGNSVTEGSDNLNIQKRSYSRYLCTGLKRLRKLLPGLEYTS